MPAPADTLGVGTLAAGTLAAGASFFAGFLASSASLLANVFEFIGLRINASEPACAAITPAVAQPPLPAVNAVAPITLPAIYKYGLESLIFSVFSNSFFNSSA